MTDLHTALTVFINQRPGLNPRDYDAISYSGDSKKITGQLKDARALMLLINWEQVTADTIKRAFSNRLTWDGKELNYVTGQYFPTEYRWAACNALSTILFAELFRRFKTVKKARELTSSIVGPRLDKRWFA